MELKEVKYKVVSEYSSLLMIHILITNSDYPVHLAVGVCALNYGLLP